MTLQLWQRPTATAAALPTDLDYIAQEWQRSTRALGGYYSGGFTVRNMPRAQLRNLFYNWIGLEVKEKSFGLTTWEGIIYKMSLVLDGVEHIISLEPDRFRNWINVYYSNAAVVDTDQGALSYLTAPARFQDTGQDFSAWETLAGNALYRIQITNTDETVTWGYIGASSGGGQIMAAYTDIGLTTAGWNDQDPTTKTPITYEVVEVELENTRSNTGEAEDTDSQDEYGKVQYVISLAGADATAATGLRDSSLDAHGWPRARLVNQGQTEDALVVSCAGYWFTTMWRYWFHSETGPASDIITNLAGDTEFVTAGRIDTNTMTVTAKGYPMPQRIGDLMARVTEQGDVSNNTYNCGVYRGRELHYEQAPTTATYFLHNGMLVDSANQPVIPQMLEPGFLVTANQPGVLNALGGTQTQATYVDQVEWFRNTGELRLSLVDEIGSIITLQQRIQAGTT